MSATARQRGKIHDNLMRLFVAVLFLTPFILGGNRPVAWAFSAMALSATGLYYIARITFVNTAPRAGYQEFPGLFVLYWIVLAWMVIQVVPFGGLLPAGLVALPLQLDLPGAISIAPVETVFSMIRWISAGLVCYFAMVVSVNTQRSVMVLKMLFVVVVVHAAYGLLALLEFGDTILFVEKWAYAGSATGAFVNRNSFATFLAIGAVCGLCVTMNAYSNLFAEGRRSHFLDILNVRNGVILPFVGLVVVIVTLLASNSRMGVFAGLAGLAAVSLLYYFKADRRGKRRGGMALPFSALIGVGLMAWLYSGSLIDRLGSTESSADERLQLYNQVIEMISLRPATGYGGGSFEYAFPLFHHAPVSFDFVWDKAHSTYLGLWADYGILFGSLPMLIVLLGFWRIVASTVSGSRPDPVSIAAIGSIIVVALHSLIDFSMEIQGVTLLFVALLGAGLGRAARSVS